MAGIQVSRDGGIYISISGDSSALQKDLKSAKDVAGNMAKQISDQLSGAFSPTSAAKYAENLNKSLSIAARAAQGAKANLTGMDAEFRKMGEAIKIADGQLDNFVKLQKQMYQNKASEAFQRSLQNIQRTTGATNAEMNQLAKSLGGTGNEFTKAAKEGQVFSGILSKLIGLAGAYVSFQGVKSFVSTGFQANANMQDAQTGIAAMLASTQNIINAQGEMLQGREKFNAALSLSGEIAKAIDAATATASASYNEFLKTFQATLGPATSAGMSWGQNIKFISDMSNAMKVLQVDMNRLDKETLAILTGRNLHESQVLRGLPQVSADDIKNWIASGTLLENMSEQLKQFEYAGQHAASSYSAVARDLAGTIESLAEEVTKTLFGSVTQAAHELSRAFYTLENDGVKQVYVLREEMEPLVQLGQDLAGWFGDRLLGATRSLASGLEILSGFVERNKELLSGAASVAGSLATSYVAVVVAQKTLIPVILAATNAIKMQRMEIVTAQTRIQGFAAVGKNLFTAMGGWTTVVVALGAGIAYLAMQESAGEKYAARYADSLDGIKSGGNAAASSIAKMRQEIAAMSKEAAALELVRVRKEIAKMVKEFGILSRNFNFNDFIGASGSAVSLDENWISPFKAAFDELANVGYEKFREMIRQIGADNGLVEQTDEIVNLSASLEHAGVKAETFSARISAGGENSKLVMEALNKELGELPMKIEKAVKEIEKLADLFNQANLSPQEFNTYKLKEDIENYSQAIQALIKDHQDAEVSIAQFQLAMLSAAAEASNSDSLKSWVKTRTEAIEALQKVEMGAVEFQKWKAQEQYRLLEAGFQAELAVAEKEAQLAEQRLAMMREVTLQELLLAQASIIAANEKAAALQALIDKIKNNQEGLIKHFTTGGGGSTKGALRSELALDRTLTDARNQLEKARDSLEQLQLKYNELTQTLNGSSLGDLLYRNFKDYEAQIRSIGKMQQDLRDNEEKWGKQGQLTSEVKQFIAEANAQYEEQKNKLADILNLQQQITEREYNRAQYNAGAEMAGLLGNVKEYYDYQVKILAIQAQETEGLKQQLALEQQRRAIARRDVNVKELLNIGMLDEAKEAQEAYLDFWEKGIPGALSQGANAFGDFFGGIVSGATTVSDAWTNLGKTFQNITSQIISDLISAQIRMLIFGNTAASLGSSGLLGNIVGAVGGLFAGGATSSIAGVASSSASAGSVAAASVWIPSAKGNVFSNAPALSAYSGSIVDSPTVFPFARGIGLMGEAGPEAILPLKRTSGGRLGVETTGMANKADDTVQVNLIINNNASGAVVGEQHTTNDNGGMDIIITIDELLAGRVSRGGALAKSFEGRYGLSPANGPGRGF